MKYFSVTMSASIVNGSTVGVWGVWGVGRVRRVKGVGPKASFRVPLKVAFTGFC